MRVSISTAIVLASLHTAVAQDATSTTRLSLPSLTTKTLPYATTITPEELAENSSGLSSISSYAASLSSRIGPYRVRESWTDLPFFPGMANREFLSKIGESGPDLETVTYEVWMTDDILTPDNTNWGDRVKKAYRTATVAPGKYWDYDMQSAWVRTSTITDGTSTFIRESTQIYANYVTTICSYSITPPKSPDPNSKFFSALDTVYVYPNEDTRPSITGECTLNGVETLGSEDKEGRQSGWKKTLENEVYTIHHSNREQFSAFPAFTILGEAATATTTATDGAVQTGGGSATEGSKNTSTQTAGAAEATIWVNAVVVVGAVAALAL